MKTSYEYWTIKKLVENVNCVEFPEFQREPTVWNLQKKQLLIDSILRGFDISAVYFFKRNDGSYDCIDGRQRISAILSYYGINGYDEDHNGFNLKVRNEIYDDAGFFEEVQDMRYENLKQIASWRKRIEDYKLNIVFVADIDKDEELNLLFLRLQIASILNGGEKLNAMTGDMRDWIFSNIKEHAFFKGISIASRRFAREQVATQITLNAFAKKNDGTFKRSRFVDMQDFFKKYSKFDSEDKKMTKEVKSKLDKITKHFKKRLRIIRNRATAVSVYLFVSSLIESDREDEIDQYVDFLEAFLRTLKWQVPKGVKMHEAYHDLLKFQTSISQAAGEKTAIQKRHDFIVDYFYYFNENGGLIKGDKEYKTKTKKDPNKERKAIKL